MTTEVQGPDDIRPPVEETDNISPDMTDRASLSVAGPFGPADEAREVKPFFFLDNKQDNPIKDFRAVPQDAARSELNLVPEVEDEVAPDPKDLSALESAALSPSTETEETEPQSASSASRDETVSAEKDSGKPKENEKSGTPVF